MWNDDAMSATRELREVGYTVIPGFVPPATRAALHDAAVWQLEARHAPLELEADLRYPGAPASRIARGGDTVRRLLDAYSRDALFAELATQSPLADWMRGYFGEPVSLSRAHHNCLMTKHPRYGSLTGWHRDIRYWSFLKEDLVSVWIALGNEAAENGGLWLVPGSHRLMFDAECFDKDRFFRDDIDGNQALLRTAVSPHLNPGDALFFHCNTLHSAGQNQTDTVKFSLVFTYHGASNLPLAGTRSNSIDEVSI